MLNSCLAFLPSHKYCLEVGVRLKKYKFFLIPDRIPIHQQYAFMILVIYCHQWILQELVNLILLAWTHRASAAWLIILKCRARSKEYRLSYTVSWKVNLVFSSIRQWMWGLCWSSWEFPALTWSWWSLLRSPAAWLGLDLHVVVVVYFSFCSIYFSVKLVHND